MVIREKETSSIKTSERIESKYRSKERNIQYARLT